jgi:hypothetical protein
MLKTVPMLSVAMFPVALLGQGAFMGEEAVLADSGWAGEKADHFEHP